MTNFPDHPIICEQRERWELPRLLLGGTKALRDAAERGDSTVRVLPREPGETTEQHHLRIRRSFNFPAFEDAVNDRADRPFVNPMTVSGYEGLEEAFKDFIDDVDLQGRSMSEFARDLSRDAHAFGIGTFIAEWSRVLGRPYLTKLQPGDLFDFEQDDETQRVTMIRFRRTRFDRVSENGQDCIEQSSIVYEYQDPSVRNDSEGSEQAVRWIRYRENAIKSRNGDGGDSEIEDEGVLLDNFGNPITEIPLIVVYANRKGFMEAKPPLEGLAWLNLGWFQSRADHNNILRYARVPRLITKGLFRSNSDVDVEGKAQASKHAVSTRLDFESTDGDARWLEPTGKAIELGMEDMAALERLMEKSGAPADLSRSGLQTATASIFAEERRGGGVLSFIRTLEGAMTVGLEWAFRWMGQEMPDGVRAHINEERRIGAGDEERGRLIVMARKDRMIGNVAAISELKRIGILSDDVDEDLETSIVNRETSLIGLLEDVEDDEVDDDFGAGIPDPPQAQSD